MITKGLYMTTEKNESKSFSVTIYVQQGENCKVYPNIKNCILLQKLYDLHLRFNLPHKMRKSRIFYPTAYYDNVSGVYLDVKKIATEICEQCQKKTR